METNNSVLGFKMYFGNQLLQTSPLINVNADLLTPSSFCFSIFRVQDKLLKHTNTIREGIRVSDSHAQCAVQVYAEILLSPGFETARKFLISILFCWSVSPLASFHTCLPSEMLYCLQVITLSHILLKAKTWLPYHQSDGIIQKRYGCQL